MTSPAAFARKLERSGSRLMIRSVCARCGDSQLVSKHDGSLQEWEDGHRCNVAEAKKEPASAGRTGIFLRKTAGGKPGEIS